MKYKNYIFDLYGTLIDIHTDEDRPLLWEKFSLILESYDVFYSPLELKEAYKNNCKKVSERLANTKHIVEIDIDKVFKEILINKNNNLKISKKEISNLAYIFRVLSRDYLRLYPNTIKTLEALKNNNCHLYLLSNAQKSFTYNEIKIMGLDKYFDDMFISSDYGIKKPDKEYLNKLIKKHNLKKRECIFIGNELDSDIKIAYLNKIDSVLINTDNYDSNKLNNYFKDLVNYKVRVINNMEELLKW